MIVVSRKTYIKAVFIFVLLLISLFLAVQKTDAASTAYGWARPAGNLSYICTWPDGAFEFYLHDANTGNFISGGKITVDGQGGVPGVNPFLYPWCRDTFNSFIVDASRSGYRDFHGEFTVIDSVANDGRGTGTRINIYLWPSTSNAPSVHITSPANGTTTSSSSLTFSVYNRRLPVFASGGVLTQFWRKNGGWQGAIATNFPYDSTRNYSIPLDCGNNNIAFSHNEQTSIAISSVADINVTRTCGGQPDLVIRNGSGGTSPPITGPTTRACGELGTYTFRTKNIGSAAAGSSTMKAWSIGSTNISDTYSIGSLAANSSWSNDTYTTSWNTAGVKQVWVKADDPNSISETNESNNWAMLDVTVLPCDNDELLVVYVFIDVNANGILDAGEKFNSGGRPPFNSTVAQIDENSSNNSPPIKNVTSSFPSNGQWVELNKVANKTYQYRVVPQGDWDLTKWRATSASSSCSADTSCNYAPGGWTGQLTLSVGTPVAFYLGVVPPDLVIRNSSGGTSPPIDSAYNPSAIPCDQDVTFTARTKNIGRATARSGTVTRATAPGSTNPSQNFTINNSLAYNALSGTHFFTTRFTSQGSYSVTFKADNPNSIVESDETNNEASINVTVSPCAVLLPDYVITDAFDNEGVVNGPPGLACGDEGTWLFHTRNIGDADAKIGEDSRTRVSTSGAANQVFPVPPLAKDTSEPDQYKMTWTTDGTKTIYFKADYWGEVDEITNSNNTVITTVEVTCVAPKPDLVIRNGTGNNPIPPEPPVDGPAIVTCNENATYMFTTRNEGVATAAGGSDTEARTSGSSNDSQTYPVGALPVDTYVFPPHFYTTMWSLPGLKTITFEADINDEIDESDEDNDVAMQVLVECPVPAPDLDPELFVPANIEVGDTLVFDGSTIKNDGDVNASAFSSWFCIGVSEDNCYIKNFTGAEWESETTPTLLPLPADNIMSVEMEDPWIPSTAGDWNLVLCADVPGPNGVVFPEEDDDVDSNCDWTTVTVEVATPDAWLKTTGGDVGSFSAIDNIKRDISGIDFNAEYLVISNSSIHIDFITRGWKIHPYTGGIQLDPNPGSSMYDALWNKYGKRCTAGDLGSNKKPTPAEISNLVTPDCNIVRTGEKLEIEGSWTYTGLPAIIFVEKKMEIEDDLEIAAHTGLIFVVKDRIEVEDNVKRADGVFITNARFHSRDDDCGNNIATADPLEINGAVYAFTELCFTRDLGVSNGTEPAEIINYEPKYLYLFGDIVGDPTVIYREVAP